MSAANPNPTVNFADFKEFLELAPIGGKYYGYDILLNGTSGATFCNVVISLHCDGECGDTRNFRRPNANIKPCEFDGYRHFGLLHYCCNNCRKMYRYIALVTDGEYDGGIATVIKIGQYPRHGKHLKAKTISLIKDNKDDYDLLMKGRESEALGLGIGAYTYYRRLVEHAKNRLIDKIIEVARQLQVDPATIAIFENAKREQRFKQAMEQIKDVVPKELFIAGHNPISVLHDILSKGIHGYSDEESLELAGQICDVLGGLAENMSLVLRGDSEAEIAMKKLLQKQHEGGRQS